eukprot:239683-Amphidinium_carterae.2
MPTGFGDYGRCALRGARAILAGTYRRIHLHTCRACLDLRSLTIQLCTFQQHIFRTWHSKALHTFPKRLQSSAMVTQEMLLSKSFIGSLQQNTTGPPGRIAALDNEAHYEGSNRIESLHCAASSDHTLVFQWAKCCAIACKQLSVRLSLVRLS